VLIVVKPLVSVIVRAFNAEKYIRDALNSIYSQSYDGPIEVVLCFDRGSPSRAALDIAYEVDRERKSSLRILKIVEHDHVSPFRALLECGFRHASGSLIFVLDHDDVISENYVEALSRVIAERGDQVIAFGKIVVCDENLNKVKEYEAPSNLSLKSMLYTNPIPVSAMFTRRALHILTKYMARLEHRLFDWIHEDYLMWLILAAKGFEFVYEPSAIFYYRIHEKNITGYLNADPIHKTYVLYRDLLTLIAFQFALREELSDQDTKLLNPLSRAMYFRLYRILKLIGAKPRHQVSAMLLFLKDLLLMKLK